MNTISIQIPENAVVGDALSFIVDGQTLEMEVPPGSEPGDVLEIQVGGAEERQSSPPSYDTEEDVVEGESSFSLLSSQRNSSIPLSSGSELFIFTSLSTCTERPTKAPSTSIPSSSEEQEICDGTHAMAWPAGLALVKYIGSPKFADWMQEKSHCKDNNIQSVLELGSGVGIVGLAFSHFLSRQQHHLTSGMVAQVVLSDLPEAMPLLEYNIQQNDHLVSSKTTATHMVNVTTAPLMWHCLPTSSTTSRLDWILGSDLLYNHKSIPALSATIQRLLSTSTTSTMTQILLSVRWRKPDLERDFFTRTSQFIDWTLLEGTCRLSWESYGNPDCHESNVYFSQTLVSVQGVPTPLAEIDETANHRMTNDEFEAWERVQIQIYQGKPKQRQSSLSGVKRGNANISSES